MAAQQLLVIERNPKIGGLIAGQLKEKGHEAEDVRHGAEVALSLRSTRVMRVCRSAFFSFQSSLMQQALSFLGIDEIRAIVQMAVIHNIFDDETDGGEGMSLPDCGSTRWRRAWFDRQEEITEQIEAILGGSK